MGRVYTGLPEFLPGEAVVLNGGVEGVAAERIVVAPEGFGGIGLNACKEKVFIGVVMDPGGHIVKVAHEVVRNAGGPGRGGPVAVAEAGAQDEIQAPLGLLHQAQIEHLILFAGSCVFKERLDHLAGLGGLLGSVSRVMPAARRRRWSLPDGWPGNPGGRCCAFRVPGSRSAGRRKSL